MKITFLGTGADTAYPLPFCKCEFCVQARNLGGPNLRKRTLAIINTDLIIDLGPDLMSASFMHNIDVSEIRYCLITHPHDDHFDAAHLSTRIPDYAVKNINPLEIFASALSFERMTKMLVEIGYVSDINNLDEQKRLNIKVNVVDHANSLQIGQYQVTSFSSNHDEDVDSRIYSITQNNKTILYCTDTDTLTENTWKSFHDTNQRFDLIVMDHTYGFGVNGGGHLNGDKFVDHIERFKKENLLNANAKILATHISHEGNPPHTEMSEIASKFGYEIAYDGQVIDL